MTKYYTKEEYDNLNEEIRNYYYDKKKNKTKLIPSDNDPSYVKHKKVVIMCDIVHNGKRVSELISNNEKEPYLKHKIELFHIGDQKKGRVSLGYDKEDNIFFHPAMDFGGLTSIGQTPGDSIYKLTKRDFYKASKGKLFKKKFLVDSNTNINLLKDEIYITWKTLSNKKKFWGDIKKNLTKVLQSLKEYLKETDQKAFISFYQLLEQHCIIVKQNDIKQKFGLYMVRIFSGDDNKYAKKSNDTNLFTLVKEKYANLNINVNNIRNEYSTY